MAHEPNTAMRRAVYALAISTAWAFTAPAASPGSYSEMREALVGADGLLSADVTNGLDPIAEVHELVLSSDNSRLEYVLYDVPYPYTIYAEAESGFVTFDNIEFDAAIGPGADIRFANDDSAEAPDQLELTAAEAGGRVVSRLLGSPMRFTDGETRRVTDILFDRESGRIAYYVVDMEAESLFDRDRRTIPADMVSIGEQGMISASTDIAGVDEITQQYDESLL